MNKEYDQAFDHLIPEITNVLVNAFVDKISTFPELCGDVDTSPFLNMSISSFISALINVLGTIKRTTKGEEKLHKNMDLLEQKLINMLKELSFVKDIEWMKS